MSGGDVGPLGKDAVTQLHGLFRWAAKSPRCAIGNGNDGTWILYSFTTVSVTV